MLISKISAPRGCINNTDTNGGRVNYRKAFINGPIDSVSFGQYTSLFKQLTKGHEAVFNGLMFFGVGKVLGQEFRSLKLSTTIISEKISMYNNAVTTSLNEIVSTFNAKNPKMLIANLLKHNEKYPFYMLRDTDKILVQSKTLDNVLISINTPKANSHNINISEESELYKFLQSDEIKKLSKINFKHNKRNYKISPIYSQTNSAGKRCIEGITVKEKQKDDSLIRGLRNLWSIM